MNNEINEPYGFIYITTNLINGKRYIGQRRFIKYGSNKWQNYLGSGVVLKKAIKKYEKENFVKDIVSIAYNKEELDYLEIEWINNYIAVASDNYYNIADGGRNNPYSGKSEEEMLEIRSKISESRKGKYTGELNPNWKGGDIYYNCETCNKEYHVSKYEYNNQKHHYCSKNCSNIGISKNYSGKNHPMYGKCHSEETIDKMIKSKSNISQETKEKMKENHANVSGENNPMYGKIEDNNPKSKTVICITTGNIFKCIKTASKYYNCNVTNISLCCKRKQNRKTCGKLEDGTKLEWMYYEEYLEQEDLNNVIKNKIIKERCINGNV